jgi:hypothetical protein
VAFWSELAKKELYWQEAFIETFSSKQTSSGPEIKWFSHWPFFGLFES